MDPVHCMLVSCSKMATMFSRYTFSVTVTCLCLFCILCSKNCLFLAFPRLALIRFDHMVLPMLHCWQECWGSRRGLYQARCIHCYPSAGNLLCSSNPRQDPRQERNWGMNLTVLVNIFKVVWLRRTSRYKQFYGFHVVVVVFRDPVQHLLYTLTHPLCLSVPIVWREYCMPLGRQSISRSTLLRLQ